MSQNIFNLSQSQRDQMKGKILEVEFIGVRG